MRPRFPSVNPRPSSCNHTGCARRFAERTIMNMQRSRTRRCIRTLFAVSCAIVIAPGNTWAVVVDAADAYGQASQAGGAVSLISNDQLDSLVAPIALYPDPLLAQILAASTYPLELLQLHQWLGRNA